MDIGLALGSCAFLVPILILGPYALRGFPYQLCQPVLPIKKKKKKEVSRPYAVWVLLYQLFWTFEKKKN